MLPHDMKRAFKFSFLLLLGESISLSLLKIFFSNNMSLVHFMSFGFPQIKFWDGSFISVIE